MGEEVRPISTGRQKISKVFTFHPSNYVEFKQKNTTQAPGQCSAKPRLRADTDYEAVFFFFFVDLRTNSQLRH